MSVPPLDDVFQVGIQPTEITEGWRRFVFEQAVEKPSHRHALVDHVKTGLCRRYGFRAIGFSGGWIFEAVNRLRGSLRADRTHIVWCSRQRNARDYLTHAARIGCESIRHSLIRHSSLHPRRPERNRPFPSKNDRGSFSEISYTGLPPEMGADLMRRSSDQEAAWLVSGREQKIAVARGM